MTDQRNLILAIALSIAILLGFQFFVDKPRQEARQAEQAKQEAVLAEQRASTAPPASAAPGASGVPTGAAPPLAAPSAVIDRAALLKTQAESGLRVRIDTPSLHGSINLAGGRLDDVTLAQYRETTDPKSAEITLLSPANTAQGYYADFGWVAESAAVKVPGPEAMWKAPAGAVLTPEQPVTLTWDNGGGLTFERTFAVDKDYMFTVKQTVRNASGETVRLMPYGLAARHGTPHTEGFYILHEGPLGVFDGKLDEHKYADVKSKGTITKQTTGGWIGVTDKYWQVALIPDQAQPVTGRFVHSTRGSEDRYQVDVMGAAKEIAPQAAYEQTMRLFAGAKQVRLLDAYESQLGIKNFDLSVDFGWFYFLTKPFFYAIDFIAATVGNFGVAILIFTVIVKGVFFPLANKSYVSMSQMKKIGPQIQVIRDRFPDDKMRQNQELMALYKREKVNPVSGCLPILIQIPVFFALYKVLFVTIEMRHAPFFGWIHDLSAPDPTTIFNLFGLIPWAPPSFLMLGVWPIIMGVTMWAQMKLNPTPPDPIQQKVFSFLPIVFTFMLASFPAGLVIYWAWNNLLSIIQQYVIMKKQGVSVT
jgi:YidC/Oxa1 family membrane protein insertase